MCILVAEDELEMASLLHRGLARRAMPSISRAPATTRSGWHPAPASGEPARLLVSAASNAGPSYVVVVGASLEDRAEALDGLLAQLLVVGPLALLLSSLAEIARGAGAGSAFRAVHPCLI